tara:strand:+ start:663 stop:1343 length:681 start_codon:yes stop_codon:yes gene_type:complete
MNIENKPMTKSVDNLLLVNKPLFFSSSYLCSLLKKKLKGRFGRNVKVGHSGTLDPLASGLMIICTGKKTKILASVQGLDKEYVATIKVGATTPCYDGELAENRFYSTAHLTHSFIEKTINSFDGQRLQRPPIYSAIRKSGERLYNIARSGKSAQINPREIKIYSIKVTNINLPFISFVVSCSKGTYIRSLASDIGFALNSGAWLYKLTRTKIGNYNINKSFSFDRV